MSGAVRMDRRLYLTQDKSRVVEDGDPEAATLLCAAGGEVPHATAVRYGLVKPASEDSEPDAGREPASETPKRGRRPADKSRTAAADKSEG
jgi:hypothetical protein